MYSSRHCPQNLWSHLVRTGSFDGRKHIMQWRSSPGGLVNCSSWPEGTERLFGTSAINFRLSQSPSLLISGSGSWRQREGLLSPAARQICRRNFPPVVLSNHERCNWYAGNQTRSRHLKRDLNVFDFLRAVFRFRFIACIQIQNFSGRFTFPFEYFTKASWSFSWQPWSEKTLPICFVLSARTTVFIFMFSFTAYANPATILTYLNSNRMKGQAGNVRRLNSQISQDRTFFHYPFLY